MISAQPGQPGCEAWAPAGMSFDWEPPQYVRQAGHSSTAGSGGLQTVDPKRQSLIVCKGWLRAGSWTELPSCCFESGNTLTPLVQSAFFFQAAYFCALPSFFPSMCISYLEMGISEELLLCCGLYVQSTAQHSSSLLRSCDSSFIFLSSRQLLFPVSLRAYHRDVALPDP